MSMFVEERQSDSPYVSTIMHGYTTGAGKSIRPAEIAWHMVFVRHNGTSRLILAGPWASSGLVTYGEGAEILWVKFKLGTFMPHLPTRKLLNSETVLPDAVNKAVWLHGSAWEIPNFENIDVFLNRLVHQDILVQDTLVSSSLQVPSLEIPSRTLRHRFLQATGLSQNHIRQYERAQAAAQMLAGGCSILDTVFAAEYFDQAHMTKALKRFIGYTPAQIIQRSAIR